MPGLDPKVDAVLSAAMLRISAGTKPSPEGATVAPMSDAVPRPELDAKLDAMRQELRADRADTKAGFAEVRTEMQKGFGDLRTEMHKGFADQVKWIVGTAVALGVAGITVMTFVLNNATPKSPTVQQQPTVIVLPAQAQAPAASR